LILAGKRGGVKIFNFVFSLLFLFSIPFTRSKKANLLKAEFEAIIANAKEELASLEAKAKILRNVAREQQ